MIVRALPKVEATDSLIARLTGGGLHPRHVLVVAGDDLPDPTLPGTDVVRLRGEVSPGTLLAVALQRVVSGIVLVGERWPADATPEDIDAVAMSRLDDPEVAVAGLQGLRSDDLRRFRGGGDAGAPVESVGWAGLTFRVTRWARTRPGGRGVQRSRPAGRMVEPDAARRSRGQSDAEADPEDEPAPPRRAVAIRTSASVPDEALPRGPRDPARPLPAHRGVRGPPRPAGRGRTELLEAPCDRAPAVRSGVGRTEHHRDDTATATTTNPSTAKSAAAAGGCQAAGSSPPSTVPAWRRPWG